MCVCVCAHIYIHKKCIQCTLKHAWLWYALHCCAFVVMDLWNHLSSHIIQNGFTVTGQFLRMHLCQWSNPWLDIPAPDLSKWCWMAGKEASHGIPVIALRLESRCLISCNVKHCKFTSVDELWSRDIRTLFSLGFWVWISITLILLLTYFWIFWNICIHHNIPIPLNNY